MRSLNAVLLSWIVPYCALAAAPTKGLIAYYKFDGNAKNSAGKGLDLVSHGVTYEKGHSGQAAYFDGRGNYFATREDFPITSNQSRTISLWLKPEAFSGNANVVAWGSFDLDPAERDNNGVGRFWGLYLSQGESKAAHINTHWRLYSSQKFSYPPNSWIHLAVTYDKDTDTARFYLNGDYVGGSLAMGNPTIAVSTAPAPLHVGFFQPYLNPNTDVWMTTFHGLIDELRIYSRELTSKEVRALAGPKIQQPTPVRQPRSFARTPQLRATY